MKSAIAIDKWKLKFFRKGLTKAGFSFTKLQGVTDDTYLLQVEHRNDQVEKLTKVVRESERAAQLSKRH